MSDFKCIACRKNDVVKRLPFIEAQKTLQVGDDKSFLITSYAAVCAEEACEEAVRADPAMPYGGFPSRMLLEPLSTDPLPGVAPLK